ncbi:MAG: metal-dependent transcriptional regulator [Chloroflexi bacterium]|nr:MAG: metal-dependent transcriptional regulator [Chloroflexota bacterium]TMG66587.1 MAG: metal-dependent transcriptional regulator [Chloroflexota bacterium]
MIGARLASFLGVSAAAVSEMLHRIERDGLVELDGRKEVHLTEKGGVLASHVIRRHRLAERMLTDLLGYEWWKTHEEAERIEHAMSPEMEERLVRVLGDPQTCPHGNPMPGVTPRPTKPLDQVTRGSTATVERIPDQFEHEPGFLEYLDAQGLRPGVSVRIIDARQGEPLRIEIAGAERTIRSDCGQKVWVRA